MCPAPRSSASVNWLKVEDVTIAGYSRNAIHLKYNSRNVTLHNVVGDSQKQNGGLIVAGVALDGTVHDVLMDHVTMRNNYGRGAAGDYWNGDGFVAERGTYNLTFRDTVATGNTDAGYDIKGNNVTMLRASASGNTKNFRLWGAESVTVTDSVSTNPYYYRRHRQGVALPGAERRQRHARQFPLQPTARPSRCSTCRTAATRCG